MAFFLSYLPELKRMPNIFKGDEVFERAFEIAEYARLSSRERRRYKLNVKRMMDTYAVLSGSFNEGHDKGKIEGKIEEGQNNLLFFFSQKLGPAPPEIADGIRAIKNLDQIRAVMAQFTAINEWQELQKYLPGLKLENNFGN
jgi:hypothetical protein